MSSAKRRARAKSDTHFAAELGWIVSWHASFRGCARNDAIEHVWHNFELEALGE